MKIAIFTGVISAQKENPDVRKQYIIERLKYFRYSDISLEIITPHVSEFSSFLPKNVKYSTYKFITKKHLKVISATIYPAGKLVRSDCELIHCYTHQAATLAWVINYFRREKYFIIFEPMGLAYEEAKLDKPHSTKVKLLGPFIKFAEKLILQKSDSVIVYTHILKEYVSREFDISAHKIHVIPHGTDLDISYSTEKVKISSIRNKLNIPNINKIALYEGSISELHGTRYLIEAINQIDKKKQDISFLILGRGVLENTLKEYVEKNNLVNVHLLGFVPQENIGLYLSLADILLIPHAKCMQTELDQPTKLFEYLASGKPIVSFNLKAIAEVVGNNAILVEPDNPKAFADGILTLVDNEILREILGAKGKIIAKEYSWEISAKKQYELYTELYNKYSKN